MSFDINFNSLPQDTVNKILETMEPADIMSIAMTSKPTNVFSSVFAYLSNTSEFFRKDLRDILKEMDILSDNENYSVRSVFEEAMKMESQFKYHFPEFKFTGTLDQRIRKIHEQIPRLNVVRTFSMFRKAAAKGEIQSVKRILQESFLKEVQKSRALYS